MVIYDYENSKMSGNETLCLFTTKRDLEMRTCPYCTNRYHHWEIPRKHIRKAPFLDDNEEHDRIIILGQTRVVQKSWAVRDYTDTYLYMRGRSQKQ